MKKELFSWRKRDFFLEKIKRFSDPNHMFVVMYYRTNLLIHTQRVPLITQTMIPLAQECYEEFDPVLAMLMAKHHDDPEMFSIRGDVSLQLKLQMNDGEKKILEMEELDAINRICCHAPKKIKGYWYKEILLHCLYKDCKEALLYSYADKHDGFGEAMHEVVAGNSIFTETILNYQQETFGKRFDKYNGIKEIFNPEISKRNPFLIFPVIDFGEYLQKGSVLFAPHTESTLNRNTKMPYYEEWKKISYGMDSSFDLLIKQKEFH